ncbi:hypothetical protein VNO78_17126 [Psophocarpus tetragonolobus]|uniref:Uncharacterized protein n=1 Tax=Psophocarpus tetragonolobus TaxID=3891 RepID=A0AAN9XL53_PSOTE
MSLFGLLRLWEETGGGEGLDIGQLFICGCKYVKLSRFICNLPFLPQPLYMIKTKIVSSYGHFGSRKK